MKRNFYSPFRAIATVAVILCLLISPSVWKGGGGFLSAQASNKHFCVSVGSQYNVEGYAMVQAPDSGYVIAGRIDSIGAGGWDVYVVKLTPTGAIQWTRTVGGTGDDIAYSIVNTADGGFAVAGGTSSFGAGNEDVYVIKLDSNGTVLWTRTVGGTGPDYAKGIVQTSDHGFALAGHTGSFGAGNGDMYLVKLDSTGTFQWDKRIGNSGIDDEAYALVQSPDGGYVLCGTTYTYTGDISTSSYDFYVAKVNSTGALVWTTVLRDPAPYDPANGFIGNDYANAIINTADGGFMVVGNSPQEHSTGGFDWHYLAMKLTSTGGITWTKYVGGLNIPDVSDDNSDYPEAVVQTADGGYVIGGYSFSFNFTSEDVGLELYMVKLDANSNLLWTAIAGTALNDEIFGMAHTFDGGFALAGFSSPLQEGDGEETIYLVKFDSSVVTCCDPRTGGGDRGTGGTYASAGTTFAAGGTSSSGGVIGTGGTIVSYTSCTNALTAIASANNNLCHGQCNGTATVTPLGGVGPYTYAWGTSPIQTDSIATGLCANTYIVTITDAASNVTTTNVTISQPKALSATATPSAPVCGTALGQATATPGGGTGPYTFLWNTTPTHDTAQTATGLSAGNYIVTVSDVNHCDTTATVTMVAASAPSATTTVTPASCGLKNGTATADPAGGTGPYTFSWNTSPTDTSQQAIGLDAGNYTVTVYGANDCSVTATAVITGVGGSLVDSVHISAPAGTVCPGSIITFTAIPTNGGTTPYYQWQVNGVNAGTDSSVYATGALNNNDLVSCIMTSGASCVTKAMDTSNAIKVAIYPPVDAGTISAIPDTICQGTQAELSASGNSSTVHWQSSFTAGNFTDINGADSTIYSSGAVQNTYYREYVGNGVCGDTSAAVKLTVNPIPVPLPSAQDTLICSGDSAQICVTDTFSSYNWNTGDNTACTYATEAGGYWLTVTNSNGCTAISKHQNIATYPVPSVSIVVQGDTLSSFGQVSYQWFYQDTAITGATSSIYIARKTGNYSVQVTDVNGCKTNSTEVDVTSAGINNLLPDELQIYPNPSSGLVFIRYSGTDNRNIHLSVFDIIGQNVLEQELNFSGETVQHIDLSHFAGGVYMLQLQSEQYAITQKIIKQ